MSLIESLAKRISICLFAFCLVLTGSLVVRAEQQEAAGEIQASKKTADRITRENYNTVLIEEGETLQLQYTLESDSGNTDFSDEVITWSITANAGAFVLTKKGKITALQENKFATINATLKNGNGTYFTVGCLPKIENIDFVEDANYELQPGAQVSLNDKRYLTITRETDTSRVADEFTYESDNTDAFTVNDQGYLKAVGEGTALITIKSRKHPEISTSHEFVCGSATSPSGIRILSKHPSELCLGYLYVPLEICYEPGYAFGDTTWTSSDPDVISLSSSTSTSCSINLQGKGSVTITATSQSNPELSAEFNFTVTDNELSEDSYTFSSGFGEQINETINGVTYTNMYVAEDNGLIVLREGRKYIMSASSSGEIAFPVLYNLFQEVNDTGILTVLGGGGGGDGTMISYGLEIKASKTGNTTLTLGPKTYTIRVVSGDKPYLIIEDTNILAGDTAEIQAYAEHFQHGVTWDSSKKSVATVDENGVIKGIKPGYSTISATDKNGKTGTKKIRVLFTDVPASGIYYSKPVYWAVDKGITGGYKDDDGIVREFRPQNNCTREAVVTFLWRLAGKPEPKSMESPFPDVQDSDKYYYKAVLWAVEKGITKGYDDGTFKPDEACTREAIVTFLWRYAGKPKPTSTTNSFNDVEETDYYYKAAIWANENGIAKGYTSGEYAGGFGPKLDCLREHVVTFLYRYNDKFGTK